jgi:hypothetical protein
MSDVRPIDETAHADMGFAPSSNYLHSRTHDRVPLLIAEVPTALMVYPLAFAPDEGQLRLVAVLGLRAGKNLCLGEGGRWRMGYVPSALRAFPFAALLGGNGKMQVGFDHDSGLWRDSPDPARGERRFFDLDGQPGNSLQKIAVFLQHCASNQAITDTAVTELERAGLLVPWRFAEALSGDTPSEGLLRVDQKTLNALAPDRLARLRDANALSLAYAQIFSVARLQILSGLQDREEGPPDAGDRGMFGMDEGDLDFSLDQ